VWDGDDATCHHERAVEAPEPEQVQTLAQIQGDFSVRDICSNQVDVAAKPEESDWNGEGHLAYIPGETAEI
jgi:hypothetical protein